MNKKQAGKLGGRATVRKYGKKHMSEIGKKGAIAFWSKYKLSPVGTSYFAIITRDTREIIAYTKGA